MKRSSFRVTLLFPYIFCFFLFGPRICSASSLKPVDTIFLNCGALTDGLDAYKRRWTNDSSAVYSGSSSFSAQATNSSYLSEVPSKIPYGTARVFISTSTYTSPSLNKGRHFLRLYFLPAYYNGLDPYNATFSVIAGAYTLLENFNPATIATNFSEPYFIQEFFITIPSPGNLFLVFSPSSSSPHSFAFINGIEVVSSPELFYSGISNSSITIPTNQPFPIHDDHVLQTITRLNVGGRFISPASDSGLHRTWYNDTPYVFRGHLGVSFPRDSNVSIRYSDSFPEYIAPPDMYGTARSMGPDASVNLNYNLTWLITVDSGFRYLIRLHFCEIQSKVYKENQMVFNVYINNMTADYQFDVIPYAKSKVEAPLYTGVAVYKDYVLILPLTSDMQTSLRIELNPNLDSKPYYVDAILNGLEVFKISDSSRNLAQPNPNLSFSPPFGKAGYGREYRKTPIVGIGIGTAAAALLGIIVVLYLVVFRQWKKGKGKMKRGDVSGGCAHKLQPPLTQVKRKWFVLRAAANKDRWSGSSLSYTLNTHCRHFALAEIVAATNNFDDSLLLGVGGFGNVYKGEIDGGTQLVAIKRGNRLSEQGVSEFMNEIEMLSKLRHRHLVSLIGYCNDNSEMILVYNYMARGTLRQHLYGTDQQPLPWRQRLEICIGAAKGLHYLHTGATYTLIHRDVKTTNILLDEDWVAKVSDFGLSKMGTSFDCSHVSTGVKGTFGYFDPEYFRLQRLTDKSDVYSFGVVMLELLCARPAVDRSRPMEEISLSDWALHSIREGRTEQIIDPVLYGNIMPECRLHRFAETIEKCLAERSIDRPSMANVVSSLELALVLQIGGEEGNKGEGLATGCSMSLDDDVEEASMSSMVWGTDEERSRPNYVVGQDAMDSRSTSLAER